jgi:hypothetical protein
MIAQTDILDQATSLQAQLDAISRDILQRFPVKEYERDCLAHTTYWKRTLYSKQRKHIFQTITHQYGAEAIALYHKLGLCSFMVNSIKRVSQQKLPDAILELLDIWYRQILKDCSARSNDYYYHMFPSFNVDIKVSLLRSLPVGGPWIVDLERISFSAFKNGPLTQKWAFIKCLCTQTRGVAPFLIIHTSNRRLHAFNETELNGAYLVMAQLMGQNPSIRGIYRRSWFLDPALDDLSPELSYLRTTPEDNGAQLFVAHTTQIDVDNALRFSFKRRQLHAKGRYHPQGYAYIWPREAILARAARHSSNIKGEAN